MRDAILEMTWFEVTELVLEEKDKAFFERVRQDLCTNDHTSKDV